MKSQYLIGFLGLVFTMVFTPMLPAFAVAPNSIQITGIIRDFCNPSTLGCSAHIDFEDGIGGVQTGQVSSTLGGDDNPVYVPPDKPGFHGAANFDQWYNDVAGINSPGACTFTLNKISDTPPTYKFEDTSFFPIDESAPECESGSHFGNQGRSHNYHFTLEIHTSFTYDAGAGQTLQVSNSDDDLWYFVNDKLVVDLGGVHGPTSAPAVNLDTLAGTLGLVDGGTYPLDIFFAERHTSESNFKFTTFLLEQPTPVIGGEIIPIETTALLLAGTQTSTIWIVPLAAISGTLITIFKIRRS